MKKVLSVLLAAAMVMGMSVSAFADVTFGGNGTADPEYFYTGDTNRFSWKHAFVERDGVIENANIAQGPNDTIELETGDILYFSFQLDGKCVTEIPSNWKIKLSNADFVSGASFVQADSDKTNNALNKYWHDKGYTDDEVLVKVVLDDDFDHYEEDGVEFFFYLYDGKKTTDKVHVTYDFGGYAAKTLTKVDLDWIITVNKPTTYTYGKNEKSAYGVFDFDNGTYAEFKLYAGEKYTLSAETKYDKALSKEYDTDVEVHNFRLKNVDNVDIVFKATKDNKQVVAVVDGELIPVEAEYVTNYKFSNGSTAKGYVVEDAEYTQYALIDADVEIEVEETKNESNTNNSGNKTNPETGANDFVGAAVALAVVSVAAAGALAFKK